jgi:hypothetical protein
MMTDMLGLQGVDELQSVGMHMGMLARKDATSAAVQSLLGAVSSQCLRVVSSTICRQ